MVNQTSPSLLRLYKLGMVLFGLQAVYVGAALYYAYLLETRFMASAGLEGHDPAFISLLYLFFIFISSSVFLVFLIYHKLYMPEKSMTRPSNASSWNLALAVLGLFFGLIVGALPFAVARNMIKAEEWERKWNHTSRYFS